MTRVRSGVVSTIITVYNRAHLLTEAVNSVLAQSYRPIEIVIVDDGSTDDSGAVARSFATSHPDVIRYLHQTNQGPAAASNAGLQIITGEFVQFLDSDDLLMADKFAMQVAGLDAHPHCGISYCVAREYALGQPWSGRASRRTDHVFAQLFPALLSGKIWPTPAPLYRRSVVDDNGPFLDVSIYQDWEYECRAAARGVRLHHCRAVLADLRGTHQLEGRKKGGARGRQLPELALVLEHILGHARRAGVAAGELDPLSRVLFMAARKCAAEGYETEARRCLALARDTSAPPRRGRIAVFAALASRVGWAPAGRWVEAAEHGHAVAAFRTVKRQPQAFAARWRHRGREAIATTSGQPLGRWPGLLWHRWQHRRSLTLGRQSGTARMPAGQGGS